MIEPAEQNLYVFAHIPKTGGTSLRVHFQKYLQDQCEFIHCADKGDREAREQGLLPFSERSLAEKNKARVILGHNVNHETGQELSSHKVIHRLVVFREPASWVVSRYNQAMHERQQSQRPFLNFPDWIARFPNIHSQFNWLAYHYLKKGQQAYDMSVIERNELILSSLQNFHRVILLSELNKQIQPLMNSLGIENLTERKNVSSIRNKNFYQKNQQNQEIIDQLIIEDKKLLKKIIFK